MLFIFGECGGVSVDFIYGVRERAVFFGVGVCFAAKCGGGFVGLIDGVRERAVFFCVANVLRGRGSGAAHVVGVRFVCGRGWNGRFGAVLSEKRVKKRAFVRFRATLRGGAYNLSQKKSNLCGMRLQADVNVL